MHVCVCVCVCNFVKWQMHLHAEHCFSVSCRVWKYYFINRSLDPGCELSSSIFIQLLLIQKLLNLIVIAFFISVSNLKFDFISDCPSVRWQLNHLIPRTRWKRLLQWNNGRGSVDVWHFQYWSLSCYGSGSNFHEFFKTMFHHLLSRKFVYKRHKLHLFYWHPGTWLHMESHLCTFK